MDNQDAIIAALSTALAEYAARVRELESQIACVSDQIQVSPIAVLPDKIISQGYISEVGPVDVYIIMGAAKHDKMRRHVNSIDVLKKLAEFDRSYVSEIYIEMQRANDMVFRAHATSWRWSWRWITYDRTSTEDDFVMSDINIAQLIEFNVLTVTVLSVSEKDYYPYIAVFNCDYSDMAVDIRNPDWEYLQYEQYVLAHSTIREMREWDPEFAHANPETRGTIRDRLRERYMRGERRPYDSDSD